MSQTCGICSRRLNVGAEICPGCGVRVARRGARPPEVSGRSAGGAVVGLTGIFLLGYSAFGSSVGYGIGYLPDLALIIVLVAAAILTLLHLGGAVRGHTLAGFFLALGIAGLVDWLAVFGTTAWGVYDGFLPFILAGIAPLLFLVAAVAAHTGATQAELDRRWIERNW
ncbi:MAG: hypothetical protein ACKOTZ_03760 [Chloroflexota bacterium]